MGLNEAGHLRPVLVGSSSGISSTDFKKICPALWLSAPQSQPGASYDPIFGQYFEIWEAHATDAGVRTAGSSAGVITALAGWLLDKGISTTGTSVRQAESSSRSVPVRIITRAEMEATSGSRYAPVNAAALFTYGEDAFQIGKPCEIAAARGTEAAGAPQGAIKLSFFCAGTPSQLATDKFIPDGERESAMVRYRGQGWPGRFAVDGADVHVSLDYQTAWSQHLGPTIQWRCKLCPDGTGGDADISVGDYWISDSRGYPVFTESDGSSAVIARTERGRQLVAQAAREGVIQIRAIDMDRLRAAQPSQALRRRTLGGRILGAALAGRRVPSFRGFGILRNVLMHPVANARAALGTYRRVRNGKTGSI